MKDWAWLIPVFKYNFHGKRQPARNLQCVDSCPDLMQFPWLCMSSLCHDSHVYLQLHLAPDCATCMLQGSWHFHLDVGAEFMYSFPSIAVSSTRPRTTFPAVHPRRWLHVTTLFPVHLPRVLFAICQWDETLEKGGATRWKEPGSLSHHVEGLRPTRTSALLYYMSEKWTFFKPGKYEDLCYSQ